jgi:hypothetical protein
MNLRRFPSLIIITVGSTCAAACGNAENSPGAAGIGGQTPGAGGSASPGSGGSTNEATSTSQTGGANATGGTANTGGSKPGVGGTLTGGANSQGGSATGGAAVATGGKARGGSSNAGGATTGGSTTVGGSATGGLTATGGKAAGGSTTAGSPATGGKAAGGASTGRAATGGTSIGGASIGGAAIGGGTSTGLANFSFFVASEAALISLSGNAKGFGGDLRYGATTGLAGADKICAAIAEKSMAGSGAKQWRAFLSIAANGSETAVNAIDRVGNGPWYDRLGRLVSLTKAGLAANRPTGADTAIINDLPNESGTPNHSPNGTQVDNHDTLTGSNTSGQLASTYANTCNNWTSAVSSTGKPVLGHSWTANSGTNWIQVGHTGGGCAPGSTPTGSGQSGESGTVGSMGGYGGFYCFALSP